MTDAEPVLLPFPRRPFVEPATARAWAGDPEMAGLVRWLTRAGEWPTEPFDLIGPDEDAMCCVRVLDPNRYRAALLADAERGPGGPNVAGLRANLRRLREMFGRPHRRGRRVG